VRSETIAGSVVTNKMDTARGSHGDRGTTTRGLPFASSLLAPASPYLFSPWSVSIRLKEECMDEGTSFEPDPARVLRPEAEVTSCRQGFSRGALVRASFDHECLNA
jgi:hypothetical protein